MLKYATLLDNRIGKGIKYKMAYDFKVLVAIEMHETIPSQEQRKTMSMGINLRPSGSRLHTVAFKLFVKPCVICLRYLYAFD